MKKSKPSKQAGNLTKRESNYRDSKGDFISIPKERYEELILCEQSLKKLSVWSFKGSKPQIWQKDTVSFFLKLIGKVWKYKGIKEKLLFHGFDMEFKKFPEQRERDSPKQELFKNWVRFKGIDPMSTLADLHLSADEAFEKGELPERISRSTINECLPDLRKK
jgi:hypothetical protein